MPADERLKKISLAQSAGERNVHPRRETKPSAPEPQNAHERRVHSRRSEEAVEQVESAMDVALGDESESWERRRRDRRKNAA